MSVALINLLSTLSVAQPAPTVPEQPVEAPSDTSVQAFAEILATIFGKPLPQVPPPTTKEGGTQPSTDLNTGLNPEFQSRLDRVIKRMRDEFGHEVTVVEGFRTQQRQDALYEQGRTRPGNIVTWTKASKHSEGLAADVKIDGTYNNATGYERLAQVAEEEGLRTLGSRDPGHIELTETTGFTGASRAGASAIAPANGAASAVADVALVPVVAKVAEVAKVAKVAEVATPGGERRLEPSSNITGTATATGSQSHTAEKVTTAHQQGATSDGNANGGGKQEDPAASKQHSQQRTSVGVDKQGADNATSSQKFTPIPPIPDLPVKSFPQQSAISAPQIPPTTSNLEAVSRATKVAEIQEAPAMQPKSHVTLKIENEDGGTDRIRLNMRGTSIDTTIAVSEVSRAEQMAQRTGELRRSLEQLGLAPQTVRITTQKEQSQQQKFNHPRNRSQHNHEERQR